MNVISETFDPMSVQNVVFYLLNGKVPATKLKLNIVLDIINLHYWTLYKKELWSDIEFYDEDIQKSIYVDTHFGFLEDSEKFGLNYFTSQSDNRNCPLPEELAVIVRNAKMLYWGLNSDELLAVCFYSNISIDVPPKLVESAAIFSQYKILEKFNAYYLTYNVANAPDMLLY